MVDWSLIRQFRPRICPHCGAVNVRKAWHCQGCGQRIRGGNLIVRFIVTITALGVLVGVIYYKLFL